PPRGKMSGLCGFPGPVAAMDTPTPPTIAAPTPTPPPAGEGLTPPSLSGKGVGGVGAAGSRSAQVGLGVVLVLTLGLLALRGYGNGLTARPTDNAPVPIDLNRADRTELEQVPGIGPALARKIDEYRQEKGRFRSVDELRQV